MSEIIKVYTDGSCIGNGGDNAIAGWAIKLMYGGKSKCKSGKLLKVTNNYAEMYAVLMALESMTRTDLPVEIYSDSQYVVKTLNREFKVGANEDLWAKIFAKVVDFKDIKFIWVRGHNGDKNNEEVDELARKAAYQ